MSGSKLASIAVSLAPPDTLARAHHLQAMLRRLFYELTDRTRHEVVALRRQLGAELASALDPAVPRILTSLRPDRIVAISQLIVDYFPCEGGLAAALEPATGTGKQELLAMISRSPAVMFFGRAAASRSLAELDLGSVTLTTDDIARADWAGSLVTLVGCETAALDTDHGDLAREFINGGARAVIGTTASTAVFETLVTSEHLDLDAARARISETHARRAEVETHAIYAMTLCMSGGTGQRIVQA